MKNKLLFTLLFMLFIILFTFNSYCLAVTVDENCTISDNVIELLNNYVSIDENGCYYQTGSNVRTTATNYMVWAGKYDCFLFYFFDSGYIDGNNFVWTSNASSSEYNHFWIEIYKDGTFHSKCNPEHKSGPNDIWYPYFIDCTTSLYNSDGTVFLQPAPVTEQTILTPILEKMEMKEPIITTIVGLAKLLIPLLICLIGFWKAWKLLSKTLYNA